MKMPYPMKYDLEFEPNFKNFTFAGKETIEIILPQSVDKIKLHSAELKITSCFLKFDKKTEKVKITLDEKKEELTIKLSKKIKGKAKLLIDFEGILNDRLLGFYKSQYKDLNGKTKYLATTQFEASDARRAFPCWDDPDVKAVFDISIIADNNLSAISNMPVISRKKIGKKHLYKFSRTPKMSTYLVYLGVGEFEFLTGKLDKLLIRIVCTKGNKSKCKLSLDLTKKFLRYYENYFGIKYPLSKLDLIAIPDFAAGAMENWGAITFRETILFYDPKTSSTRTKQIIAEVVSHELAHQWFGNLVTMKWWNDLWLNESFATFMGTKAVDHFYPDWDLWDQFLESSMNEAMRLDGLENSHSIDVKVNKPSEIREIFDSISYDKGGCVLRMLENFVGKDNFRNGLRQYLSKFKYSNASGEDLWDSIAKVSKKPVVSMMDSWIKQVGFPIISVHSQNSDIVLSQNRFLLSQHKVNQKPIWSIPISIGNRNKMFSELMTKKTLSVPINHKTITPIVNSSRKGFYRVDYSSQLLSKLKPLISNKDLNDIDRWGIQNDLFALCVSGRKSVSDYLDLTEAYRDEVSYLSTTNMANNLRFLYLISFHDDFSPSIKKHALNYFRALFNNLGWDHKKGDKHTDILLRSNVIETLGKLDDEVVTSEAQNRFRIFLRNREKLRPDLREPVFSIVAWNGNNTIHDKLIKVYRRAPTQEGKIRVLMGLCSFKDEKLLLKTLEFALSDEVRSQNLHYPIIKVAYNPYAKKFLWKWYKKNWKKIKEKIGSGNPLLNRIISSLALFVDSSMEKEIREFFKANKVSGSERTLEQTLERIRIHSAFHKELWADFKLMQIKEKGIINK